MGTAQSGEDPKRMTSEMNFTPDERSEARRRLHLRDITFELPGVGDDKAGAQLRIARERRNEDLRAIAGSLRIRREQLEALEESRYDDLPGRAYAIGFVRSYAEYLGLDSADIVARYKAELDGCEQTQDPLAFPEVRDEARLPRGTFLIIALIIGLGIYGGYLMTRSADRMMAERVPAVPSQVETNARSAGSQGEQATSLSGDPASAATRHTGGATATQLLGNGAPEINAGVYAVPPVNDVAPDAAQPAEAAALTAPVEVAPPAAASAPAAALSLPPVPQGQVYGAENIDSRVTIRARKNDAWIRVEDAQGHVLIEQTMAIGDIYRAPNAPGAILVARDASAFEILVGETSLGLAGPPTLVLTGKPLDPASLIAAMPHPMPSAAEEAAALAPTMTTTR
jgi:cytoskeleton protein RodZ